MPEFPIGFLMNNSHPPSKAPPPQSPPPSSQPAPAPAPTPAPAASSNSDSTDMGQASGSPNGQDAGVVYEPQAQSEPSPTYSVESSPPERAPSTSAPASSQSPSPAASEPARSATVRHIATPSFGAVRLQIAPVQLAEPEAINAVVADGANARSAAIDINAQPGNARAAYAQTIYQLLARQQASAATRLISEL